MATTGTDVDIGEGITTKQMQAAPKGAVFVWCNGPMGYAIHLARNLGREDLRIVSPMWLEERWLGLELTGVVVDHAAWLTDRQRNGYQGALARVRHNDGVSGRLSTAAQL